jgi:hypothetical protein
MHKDLYRLSYFYECLLRWHLAFPGAIADVAFSAVTNATFKVALVFATQKAANGFKRYVAPHLERPNIGRFSVFDDPVFHEPVGARKDLKRRRLWVHCHTGSSEVANWFVTMAKEASSVSRFEDARFIELVSQHLYGYGIKRTTSQPLATLFT